MQPYQPVRPNDNPVLTPLNNNEAEKEDNNENSDDIDVTSILPGFLNNNDLN